MSYLPFGNDFSFQIAGIFFLTQRLKGPMVEPVTSEDTSPILVARTLRKAIEPYRTEDGTAVLYGFHIALDNK